MRMVEEIQQTSSVIGDLNPNSEVQLKGNLLKLSKHSDKDSCCNSEAFSTLLESECGPVAASCVFISLGLQR